MNDVGKRYIVIAAIVVTCAVTLWAFTYLWGTRQALLPEIVLRKVRKGDTYEEFCKRLGVYAPPELEVAGNGYVVVLCEARLGSLFVPQHTIRITFDENKRVLAGVASVRWRTDEEFLDFELD